VNEASDLEQLTILRQILEKRFNKGELRTFCFELGVDYDNLPGEGKANKARELVEYAERHSLIHRLITTGKRLRPDIPWNEIPETTKDVALTLESLPERLRLLWIGTCELLNRVGKDHTYYSNALAYQKQLSENIKQVQLHGDTDELGADRERIALQFDRLSVLVLGTSFWTLLDQIQLTEEQERTELSPSIVNDPLSLVELRSEGPVWRILRHVREARSHSNWNEVLDLCNKAIGKEREYRDRLARALAQLYMADALAHCDHLPEATTQAKRAEEDFGRQGNHCYKFLAQLLLILLNLKVEQDVPAAYENLKDARKKLESKAQESMWSPEVQFYRQTIKIINCLMKSIDDTVEKETLQSCCLNAIPILKLSDGPNVVLQPTRVMNHLTTEEFRIGEEGHTYLVYPPDEAGSEELRLKAGTTHFVLPVPADGWPSSSSRRGRDYVLVRARERQEGPGVQWTSQQWLIGRFVRDATTKEIHFVRAPKPYVLGGEVTREEDNQIEKGVTGEEHGYVIGLLRPKGSVEVPFWLLVAEDARESKSPLC
jgi:hypothetical protein